MQNKIVTFQAKEIQVVFYNKQKYLFGGSEGDLMTTDEGLIDHMRSLRFRELKDELPVIEEKPKTKKKSVKNGK